MSIDSGDTRGTCEGLVAGSRVKSGVSNELGNKPRGSTNLITLGESNEMKTNCLSLLMLCVLAKFAIAGEPITLKLWPDGPPTAIAFLRPRSGPLAPKAE